jgi:hypothetical protein
LNFWASFTTTSYKYFFSYSGHSVEKDISPGETEHDEEIAQSCETQRTKRRDGEYASSSNVKNEEGQSARKLLILIFLCYKIMESSTLTKICTVKAPAKAILCGEHAVVYG